MFGPVLGMGVGRPTIGVMGGAGAQKVKVDAIHGLCPEEWIAALDCHETCDNPNQEYLWDES